MQKIIINSSELIFLVENKTWWSEVKINWMTRLHYSSGLNHYEYCRKSSTWKHYQQKKTIHNAVKQQKDSNSYFLKVICKEGYYHLLSFLNNQDQPVDKLWKIICCVLCVACLRGYLGLQTFLFIRLSILYKQSFCISPGWWKIYNSAYEKKIPPTNYLATVWEIFDCT